LEDRREPEAHSYRDVRPHVRDFLERLDEDDVETLINMLRAYEKAATIGGFFKWLAVAMLATFTAVISAGESVRKLYAWLAS